MFGARMSGAKQKLQSLAKQTETNKQWKKIKIYSIHFGSRKRRERERKGEKKKYVKKNPKIYAL